MTGLLLVLLAAALAMASPAAAVDDPTRPGAEVTRGPSCRPGGIVVQVLAGAVAYTVRLSTSRRPAGEDEVSLAPEAVGTLQTADVAPGETIDPRLEFTSQDGSGTTYVDELEDYTLTRPTTEDCEAALNQPSPASAEPSATAEPTSSSAAQTPAPAPGSSTPSSTPSPTPEPAGGPPAGTSGDALPAPERPGPGPQQVVVGGTVALSGAGFLPGEQVDILLQGTHEVLATATAGPDGNVLVDVRIPEAATAGPATLDLVGADSALVTGVRLEVAAATTTVDRPGGTPSPVPLVAAAVALVGALGGLLSVAGRQQSQRRGRLPLPTA